MEAKLIVVGGDVKTTEVNLKLPCIIGRGRGTGLMLPHPLVSRQHCEIYEHEQQLVVRDLGSLNGTYINNTRLTEPTLLPSGDLLTVGTVTFRAEYQMDPNLAPPTPSAKTVRGGAPTAQAKGKAPAAEPDFSSFEEIEEVEVEEYASGIVKDSASIPAMSSNDDIDIMSMLEDEIEEVVEEAPKAPAKKPTAPSAPAAKKVETPPDHGNKPTQAGNRWASPQAPAADANETLRARPGETKQSKPDKKGGPGKASAAATNSPVVAEKKPAEPVGDDADDFLASLGIAALAATAAPAVEQLAPQEEPANIATATPDDVDEQVASHQGNGAAQHTAQHVSPLDETLLPPEVAEDLADIDVIEEDVVEEVAIEEVVIEEVVEESPPPVADNDDAFLANLGLDDLPPHEHQAETVAEDSLVAPQSALADPIEEAIAFEDVPLEDVSLEDVSLEDIAELEAAAEPATPEMFSPEPIAEDALQAPLTSSFEPGEDVVELEDIELLDDVAELEAPAEPSPATSSAPDDFLAELGLSDAPPDAASHLEPTAEAVAEIPLPPAAESLVDEPQALAADEPIALPAEVSDDIEEVFELEEMEVVEEVAEVEAPAEPVSATDDDFLSALALTDTPPAAPANWEPAAEAVAELPFIPPAESTIEEPEALAADEPIAPSSETSDDSEEVFELEEMEVVEEVAEVEAPAEPVSATDDDFLSALGLSDAPPAAPSHWEPAAEVVAELPLPPAAESVDEPLPPVASDDAHLTDLGLDEPIEIEEVFEVDEMEVVDEVEAPVAAAPLESPPATDADIDDFLADLGLEALPAAPVEPAAELPPEMWPPEAALSEPVEVEEVFDLVEMDEIEEVEEISLDAELPPPADQLEETWLEAPASLPVAEPTSELAASDPAPSPGWGEPVAEDSLMAPLPLGSAEPTAEDNWSEPVSEDSTYAPLLPQVEEPLEAAAAAEEVELSDIELVEEELVEEIDEAEELAEPVAVETSADSDVDSFLADLGLDDPLPAAPLAMESSVASEAVDLAEIDQVEEVVDLSVAHVEPIAPHIEPLLAFETVAELPDVEMPGAEMGASETLVEVDPLSADSTIEPADAVVDLGDVVGVEEVFDLDVEEVSFDEVEPAAPAALPFASAIVPLVDTSLMAGEFLDESPTALTPAEESANNFASAPPFQSEEVTDDMFAEQMFADLSADEPVSEIETLEEPEDIVEVPEEVADEEPVAIAPAPVAAPRSLPTPLHVAKPYAYANPVARFPMARWTPPVDNGPIIEPVKFPHAAPRPHTASGEAVTSVVLPLAAAAMAAAPLAAAPLEEIEEVAELPVKEVSVEEVPVEELAMIEELPASEEPEVVEEVAEVDEDLDAFLKDLGQ